MAQVRVKLTPEDNGLIERQFYEYNAARDIIVYLMQQQSINEDYLQQYINIAERRFVELEMNKKAVDKAYRPKDIEPSSYSFDFEAEELVYEV